MIPILDLKRQYNQHKEALDEAVLAVMESGGFILGPTVERFEKDVAQWLDANHAIGVATGTDALYLALRACGVGPGDEVITTAFTYIATSESIVRAGARPVFVDIDPQTYNMDVNKIEAAITDRTKAILPVHLYGQPVDMDAVMHIAQQRNLKVIEDCAQAIGAKWHGRAVGTYGDCGCFSFFPTKNLGAFGDGGLVTANDQVVADKVRNLRVHGQTKKYHHDYEGVNSRLDAMQAAILSVKLPYLADWNQRRREIAAGYTKAFSVDPDILTPVVVDHGEHVFHQYTIQVPNRDAVQTALNEAGIATMVYYPIPCHLQGMHADLGYQPGSLPITESVAQRVLSLPIFPELTHDEQHRVIEQVHAAVKQQALPV
ncbi:MAG: DegT/DnrJ/EryC1/StrS family aminotransferase [Cyanobacteria bacterium HKST-UBA06]|nr:DegT/DnrJ/EryC1/StrS family aminotransferase [Cyanobacteria bacterium HKST-UBA04]MCA9808490.1 DegT/DnrJ/EryC1/StrS family aminotransferase [Cyanobacteria bacterium HKST-UBA06]MCA9842051.1 DegT/DnrJ/EryC1/StrS family aminotransferase [Cyanobacteria bacterium HKST-UBA03]